MYINNKSALKVTRKKLRNNSTKAELFLWKYLQKSQFEGLKFRRQHSIDRYILDFYCPKLKISIELDGEIHNLTKDYDKLRTQFLYSYWITEIRFTNNEILENIDITLEKLKKFISSL